ncbi:unnamed protein product [Phyllotreta striolata]|uniref:Uncharacterized protein n=1 Tax=Phyllotreta striolata TaxID=444603 RepID=A0A9N9TJW6_PHYSR|nr:unnamed protein product [Phyllotreta striolata]
METEIEGEDEQSVRVSTSSCGCMGVNYRVKCQPIYLYFIVNESIFHETHVKMPWGGRYIASDEDYNVQQIIIGECVWAF